MLEKNRGYTFRNYHKHTLTPAMWCFCISLYFIFSWGIVSKVSHFGLNRIFLSFHFIYVRSQSDVVSLSPLGF